MSPSHVYKMTLSPEQLALVEQCRGVMSLQEYTLAALLDRCQGSAAERELRAELERLHSTLRDVLVERSVVPVKSSDTPREQLLDSLLRQPTPAAPDKLDW
jgi:hypothetical protein